MPIVKKKKDKSVLRRRRGCRSPRNTRTGGRARLSLGRHFSSSRRLDHGEPRNGSYLALVEDREVALAQFADRASLLITNHRWNQQFRHLDMQRDSAGGNLPRRRNVEGQRIVDCNSLSGLFRRRLGGGLGTGDLPLLPLSGKEAAAWGACMFAAGKEADSPAGGSGWPSAGPSAGISGAPGVSDCNALSCLIPFSQVLPPHWAVEELSRGRLRAP